MAKKKKKKSGGGVDDVPAWLITFSDMMTLMLTFFVLLVSMSVMDNQRKMIVLGSIMGTFGDNVGSHDVLTTQNTQQTVEPGPMETKDDLQPLQQPKWEDMAEDLRFAENKFVQVFSIGADLLFDSGSSNLSGKGVKMLNDILPVLKSVKYPILLAGHTSNLRDEQGENYRVQEVEGELDPSWKLSLYRVLAVYRYLLSQGMDPDKLRVEAMGKYHPRFSYNTPEDRRMNRRVDIVVDKRMRRARDVLRSITAKKKKKSDEYDYKGFKFEINSPKENN